MSRASVPSLARMPPTVERPDSRLIQFCHDKISPIATVTLRGGRTGRRRSVLPRRGRIARQATVASVRLHVPGVPRTSDRPAAAAHDHQAHERQARDGQYNPQACMFC